MLQVIDLHCQRGKGKGRRRRRAKLVLYQSAHHARLFYTGTWNNHQCCLPAYIPVTRGVWFRFLACVQ